MGKSAAFAALWLSACAAGLGSLLAYKAVPGPRTAPSRSWPSGSDLPRRRGLPSLVLVAHPRCDCTRATLDELRWILARAPGRAAVSVLFVKPDGAPADWEDSGTFHAARSLPSVAVRRDPGAAQARLFGAQTSGHVLLYDGDGRLRFSGGITGARGHGGDNAGRASVLALLRSQAPAREETPVFGCALASSEEVL